jgi:hypothetical protein
MKLGIMQPYFLPYIGYWQLINSVDEFVIYDNIKYTKKGWINRNRILCNGKDEYITIPLKKDSDYLDVKDRYIAYSWDDEKNKILNKIRQYYKKSPQFSQGYTLFETCISCEERNLFKFILNSVELIKTYLDIKTPLIISSTIPSDQNLQSEDKVLDICKVRKATTYINASGGVELYDKNNFTKEGMELNFIKSNQITYKQFDNEFIPWLSILDVLMFNSKEEIQSMLNNYTLF